MWLYNITDPAADSYSSVDPLVFYIYCAVSGLLLVLFTLSVAVIGCGCKRWGFMSGIDQAIIVGGLLLAATVLARGVPHANWTSLEAFTLVCQIYPAPMTLGLSYLIGGLLVKAASILDHYQTVEKSKRPFRLWKPALGMFMLLLVDAAIVIVWSVLFTNRGEKGSHYYACVGPEANLNAKDYFEWTILAYHAALLLIAAVLVWPALYKVISGPASTETKFTTFIVYNVLLACVIPGIVIHFLLYNQARISETVYYAVIGGLTLYSVLSTTVLLMFSQGIVGGHKRKLRKAEEDF